MKKLATILLLKLMLLPVIWNGIGLWHYVVEHTHTFCTTDSTEHFHQTPKDCVSICQLTNNQPHQQLPTVNEYHELKTCITPDLFLTTFTFNLTSQSNFMESPPLEIPYSNDIFQPPIG